jgi:hypothetical protein
MRMIRGLCETGSSLRHWRSTLIVMGGKGNPPWGRAHSPQSPGPTPAQKNFAPRQNWDLSTRRSTEETAVRSVPIAIRDEERWRAQGSLESSA